MPAYPGCPGKKTVKIMDVVVVVLFRCFNAVLGPRHTGKFPSKVAFERVFKNQTFPCSKTSFECFVLLKVISEIQNLLCFVTFDKWRSVLCQGVIAYKQGKHLPFYFVPRMGAKYCN